MLLNIPLFAGLSDEIIAEISNHAITKNYPKNTIIINEGDESDSLYIIHSGTVKVYLSDEEGKEIILTTQHAGEYFGELSLLDTAPRSASVMTLEDCRFSIITKRDFTPFLEKNPKVTLHLVQGLAQRLRTLTENVKSLALMDVYGRVARTLLNLAEKKNDELIVMPKLTQRDIANMVGASREMVSRIMRDLATGGYISVGKNSIVINDKLPPAW